MILSNFQYSTPKQGDYDSFYSIWKCIFFCIYSSTVNSRFTDFLAQKLCIDLVVVLHFLFSENWFDDIWISFWICFNDGISIIMKYPSF